MFVFCAFFLCFQSIVASVVNLVQPITVSNLFSFSFIYDTTSVMRYVARVRLRHPRRVLYIKINIKTDVEILQQ